MLRSKIRSFPLARNENQSVDIVYFGNVIEPSSNLADSLRDDYVFVFSTALNHLEKDDYYYGTVSIDLVRDIELSFFNPNLQKFARYHVYEGGNLVLNDFLEIHQLETDHETIYSANLKSQTFYEDYKPRLKTDLRVFLFSEINWSKGGYNNLPSTRLAPEFETKLQVDFYEEMHEYYSDGYTYLCNLKGQMEKIEDREYLEKIIQLAKEKKEESSKRIAKNHEEYIIKLNECNYYYRNIK